MHRPLHPLAAALFVALTLALALGACSVTIGSTRPGNAVTDRALETDSLRLDLSDGLTVPRSARPTARPW